MPNFSELAKACTDREAAARAEQVQLAYNNVAAANKIRQAVVDATEKIQQLKRAQADAEAELKSLVNEDSP